MPAEKLTGKPPYKAHVRLLAQPVPVNLIIAMQNVGFDYGMTPKSLADDLVAGTQVLWEKKLELTEGQGADKAGLTTTPVGSSETWSLGAFNRD